RRSREEAGLLGTVKSRHGRIIPTTLDITRESSALIPSRPYASQIEQHTNGGQARIQLCLIECIRPSAAQIPVARHGVDSSVPRSAANHERLSPNSADAFCSDLTQSSFAGFCGGACGCAAFTLLDRGSPLTTSSMRARSLRAVRSLLCL